MSLSIEINGNRYKNFIDARVERSLEAAASSFSFTVSTSSDGTSSIPISQDSTIKIFADDQVILTGYIDSINPSYNISSHAIKFVGRSKTCDLVDCTIGSITEYKTTTLKVLCEAICSYFEIDVLDETTGVDTIEQVASPTAGQTAYKFLESFAKTRHVLLTDNELGNLLLTQSSSSLSSNIIKGIAGQNDNNIKSGSRVLDLSNIYGEYTVQSQLNPLDQAITTTPSVSSNQVGVSLETNARAVRKLEFYEAESSSSLTLQERADWERAIRRARGLYFSVLLLTVYAVSMLRDQSSKR